MRLFWRKLLKQKWTKQLLVLFVLVSLIWAGLTSAHFLEEKIVSILKPALTTNPIPKNDSIATAPSKLATEVSKNPPKYSSSGKISGSTKTNTDGTKTTTVSDGNASTGDFNKATNTGPSGSNPYAVNFSDETGQNAALEGVLKDYLNSSLRWGNEVSAMYTIIIRDAGASDWAGQYNASYTTDGNNKIISVYGFIILNTYYYKNNPAFNDYMKYTFSHEYGHHYTLYHRWIDWNIPAGERWPDSYYLTRPLSKSSTAVDYSKGWSNCDTEIMAEDYSYIYSGYGIHQMSSTYGYPSAGMQMWLNNIVDGPGATQTPAPNNLPSISITEPAVSATISGIVSFKADATDDQGVTKVNFYVDDSLLVEDSSSPYETTFISGGYGNSGHTLKAIAYDASQSTTTTISVTFNNQAMVSFISPVDNPYTWSSGDLTLSVAAAPGANVTKIELYIENQLVATENSSSIIRIWPREQGAGDSYTLKARGYEANGNYVDTFTVINKQ